MDKEYNELSRVREEKASSSEREAMYSLWRCPDNDNKFRSYEELLFDE